MSGTVLVAVDFATYAEEVGLAAARLAHRVGARLVVMHVVDLGGLPDRVSVAMPELGGPAPIGEIVTEEARLRMAPLRERLEAEGVEVQLALRRGNVVDQVWSCAHELHVDYVVIGSDVPSGLRRLLPAGSFTEAILRKATCPVVVVRATGEKGTLSPGRQQVRAEADG
ncbi:MAG: universal stress protein [Alphaproteobacteria bacterium]|nr:universal stress protein [Alphaproteobacteria bacterium]